MKSTLVSVVVAVYKSEPFLRKLIESIIQQTYRNLEILLVDDGSPDHSGEICDEFSRKDERIKVIHKENGGACDARNRGLQESTGEYITIIDGDDWLELDYIEYLLSLVKETGSDMAMTDKIFTTRDRVQTQNDKIEVWSSEKAAAAIIYPIIPIGPWNKLYSKKLIEDNNLSFSTPWSGEGLYFSFMAAQYSNQVAVGHRKIYNYRLNNTGSGLTNYNVQMGLNALFNIQHSIKDNIKNNSKIISNAVEWHIWKNYNFLLFLIIATDTQKDKYKSEYNDCINHIRHDFFRVFLHADINNKEKMKMIFQVIMPSIYAKLSLLRKKRALAKDKME